ncbi:MAG: adenosylcobinamide-GDP ribazoletransferase [Campylobacterales bacterium]|nr:adenosylcobinamide-GDP ribazoletransferase [Campylobacterales bacterium]
MRDIFKGFALAVSMLTTLPFFRVHDFSKGINGYAVMFYPLVGFILGTILWGMHELLNPYISHAHLGVIIFGMWIFLTGALHLDGLSDTIDGIYAPKERALQVMKEPHIGAMGMIFTATFLIVKASTLWVFDVFYLLPLVLMLSRFNTVLAIYLYPYVSPNGMSSFAKNELRKVQVLAATFYVIIFGMWALGSWSFVLMFANVLVLFVIKLYFVKRYGGFTGDIYGFTIEITELILLNSILIIGIS